MIIIFLECQADWDMSIDRIRLLQEAPWNLTVMFGSPMDNHRPRTPGARLIGFTVPDEASAHVWCNPASRPALRALAGLEVSAAYRVARHDLHKWSWRSALRCAQELPLFLIAFLLIGWWYLPYVCWRDACWNHRRVTRTYIDAGSRPGARRFRYDVDPAPFLVWSGLRRPYSRVVEQTDEKWVECKL